MPSKSKSQQRLFGMVHAYQTGKLDTKDMPDDLADKIRSMSKTVSKKAAKDFVQTKTKKLPQHVQESDVRSMTLKTYLNALEEDKTNG